MGLLIRGVENILNVTNGGAVTIGNFDGVHRGHRTLLERLKIMAEELRGPSVVFTFDPPPAQLLRPNAIPPALTWMERRAEILFSLGIDILCICETTHELLNYSPQAFFQKILIDKLKIRGMVEGPNFRFGKDRRGDADLLMEICQEHDIRLFIASAQSEDGEWISSSRIRSLISHGDIQGANRLLLEPYRISGKVAPGAARGRQLGFPTANLVDVPVLVPPHGVYAGRVTLAGERRAAAMNIGPNPTFGEDAVKIEVHLVGFHGDLYGQQLEIEVLEQIRGVRKFSGVEELIEQLKRDIDRTRALVT